MGEIEPSSQLLKLDLLIAQSNTTTAFLEVMRLEEQIRLAQEQGADEIEGQPKEWAFLRLNAQKNHYRALCAKHGIAPHL